MIEVTLSCYQCGTQWTVTPPISRREECPQCHRDAHVCLNCRFHDPKAYRSCRETQAEYVQEKDRSNFCSYFEPRNQNSATSEKDLIKQRLDTLFQKKDDHTAPQKNQGDDLKTQIENFMKQKKSPSRD
jgi:hypothetical protein